MGGHLKGGGGLDSGVVVGAVLLAAGSGSRIGTRPKCLLELDGVALVRRLLIALSGAGVDEVVVVLGHHAEAIAPVLQGFAVTLVRNPRPADGIVSSQRIGLAALSGRLDAIIVALADQPLIQAQDITSLIDAWKKRPAGSAVVFPRVDGERGNPVIFDAAVREQILAGDATLGCRQWQAANAAALAPFDSDNRHYRVDIDTDDDLARFERETGHTLRWPAAATV